MHQSLSHCCEWSHGHPLVLSDGAVQSGGGGGASSSFMSSSSLVGVTTGGIASSVHKWHLAVVSAHHHHRHTQSTCMRKRVTVHVCTGGGDTVIINTPIHALAQVRRPCERTSSVRDRDVTPSRLVVRRHVRDVGRLVEGGDLHL